MVKLVIMLLEAGMQKKIHGMTLIEVLIALAIVSIAMTAIIKATSQNIRSTRYLQEKTIANWVGQEILNEARVDLLKLPKAPDFKKGMTTIFNQEWYWSANTETTPNSHIQKISVSVYNRAPEESEETSALASMETYVYHTE